MHLKIVFVAVAICAAPCALAQDRAAKPKETYFLIDASGSMEKRQTALDAALVAKRKEIELAGHLPAIETRFGGTNGGVCGTPVEIGKTNTGPFQNDNTQIGAALGAALKAAGKGPADIFIFTDEEQTPACGVDVCTVADRFLPAEGIFAQFVPIDAAPYDHGKARCLAEAQDVSHRANPFLQLSLNIDQITIGAEQKSL